MNESSRGRTIMDLALKALAVAEDASKCNPDLNVPTFIPFTKDTTSYKTDDISNTIIEGSVSSRVQNQLRDESNPSDYEDYFCCNCGDSDMDKNYSPSVLIQLIRKMRYQQNLKSVRFP